MSDTEATLVNRMAAKTETTEIYSIQMHGNLKTMSSCESPTGPKHSNKDKNIIGESSTSPKESLKFFDSVQSDTDKNDKTMLESDQSLNSPNIVGYNDLDFDDCHITEVINFLQKWLHLLILVK